MMFEAPVNSHSFILSLLCQKKRKNLVLLTGMESKKIRDRKGDNPFYLEFLINKNMYCWNFKSYCPCKAQRFFGFVFKLILQP